LSRAPKGRPEERQRIPYWPAANEFISMAEFDPAFIRACRSLEARMNN
jgi:hypothetical protein